MGCARLLSVGAASFGASPCPASSSWPQPSHASDAPSDGHFEETGATTGMTLRDYFAAQVAQGLCTDMSSAHRAYGELNQGETLHGMLASLSYSVADAMLAERDKS